MAYKPPAGSQIISAGKGNNYYVYTQNGTTSVVTTGGLLSATTTNKGKSYTFTSTGNKDTNLKSALSNPQSSASKTVQQNAGKVSPNTAPTAPDPDAPGSPPPAPSLPGPDQSTPGTNQLGAGPTPSKTIAPKEGLRYPIDIAKTKQDRIMFQACELNVREFEGLTSSSKSLTPGTQGFLFKFPEPSIQPVPKEGPVVIAIQAPISDQNSVEWGPDSVNAIQSATFGASLKLINTPGQQVPDMLRSLFGATLDTAGIYKDRIQKLFAGEAASINNILARTDNVVLNPNLELLFSGPQLRPFNFTFKMSAREKPEADVIKSIIKYFKYHMAVRKEDGLFLKAPHVFKIEYQFQDLTIEHPAINQIKTCALTNFSVDYTPLGSYMTYQDGTMVAYTLSMSFQELTPIYDDDYKDHPIGY